MTTLPCVEIEPNQQPANASVILLHGIGADGHDFEPLPPELGLPDTAGVRFVFPHAPSRPVTVNAGMQMPSWYDILEMQIDRKVDTQQLRVSSAQVHELIDRERERGVAAERIIVAGFSQGGAVAIEAALTYPETLAGLMVLSSYFATADSIRPSGANDELPVLVCHGTADPVVPHLLGERAARQLEERGHPVTLRTFPMEHGVCPQEIAVIGQWLTRWLNLTS